MITIEQPAMALNDVRDYDLAQMWNTRTVQPSDKRDNIINATADVARGAPGGKLKNIVVCCHANPAYLQLGEGFSKQHTYMFKKWKGLVDFIYFRGCSLAAGEGYLFCMEIAAYAKCYVVASTKVQYTYQNRLLPFGKLDIYEGMTITFDPSGKAVVKLRFDETNSGKD